MQKKKGISLIVLVITIIVMIILAGAIILTLNNNGIINKASDAVDDSNLATVKELTQMAWGEAYAKAITDGIAPNSPAMLDALKYGVDDVLSANKVDMKEYGIAVTLKGVEVVKGWAQDGLYIVKGNQRLEIGDRVNYQAGVDTYTSSWKVLGAENGNVLIMSADSVVKNVHAMDYTSHYINGISDLNTTCEQFGNGKGAVGKARSITVEDVNRVTGYDPKVAAYGKGEIYEYGNEVTYIWNGEAAPYCISTNGVKEYASDFHSGRFGYFDGEEWTTSYRNGETLQNPTEITTLKNTAYIYYPTTLTANANGETKGLLSGSKAYKMLFRDGGDTVDAQYWLASKCMSNVNGASWGFYSVNGKKVTWKAIVFSEGSEPLDNIAYVRAVVALDSSLNFTKTAESTWSY